jgi:cytochrome c peroxidase
MHMVRSWVAFFVAGATMTFGLVSCSNDTAADTNLEVALPLPAGFTSMPVPSSNRITKERMALGKRLFYEPLLSADSSTHCGSCHLPQFAFADPQPQSTGIMGSLGTRNAPSLANIAWKNKLFRDGGVDNLELSSLNPINNPHEMAMEIGTIVHRLRLAGYTEAFHKAYQTEVEAQSILNALATFMRSLISGNSRYDKIWVQKDGTQATDAEQRGFQLFFSSETNCSECHSGFLFSDESFRCNGLFETYPDSGRQRITMRYSDRGLFVVPSLRNVALTAPYMHNGAIPNLEMVIEGYNQGGHNFPNKDPRIQPLNLSAGQKADLLAFLRTLSDEEFIDNPAFKP